MKLICGTNFSLNSEATARAAASLAEKMGLPMVLAHVVDPNLFDEDCEEFLAGVKRTREGKLKRIAAAAAASGAVLETEVRVGNPAMELARLAEEGKARLIVLPQVGAIAPTEWAAGSVADKIIQISSVPALVLRDSRRVDSWLHPGRMLRVLVAFDFSPASRAALEWVGEFRKQVRCDVTVAYIASYSNPLARNGWALHASRHSTEVIRRLMERQVGRVFGPASAASVRCLVDASLFRPAGRLLEIAEDVHADLIAVGASGRQGWSRLGSFSRIVVHSARTNVLTVPESRRVSGSKRVDNPREFPEGRKFERAAALAA